MRRAFASIGILVVLSLLLVSIGYGENKPDSTKSGYPPLSKKQTLCPVMGNKIDTTVFADIQGQRVYFCCSGCISKMKADPDEYFKKSAEQGVLFRNIQKTCPVSGDEIDTTISVDYQGRRIYFCCQGCVADFEKSPAAYLAKMDKPAAKDSADVKSKGMEHEGMNH